MFSAERTKLPQITLELRRTFSIDDDRMSPHRMKPAAADVGVSEGVIRSGSSGANKKIYCTINESSEPDLSAKPRAAVEVGYQRERCGSMRRAIRYLSPVLRSSRHHRGGDAEDDSE